MVHVLSYLCMLAASFGTRQLALEASQAWLALRRSKKQCPWCMTHRIWYPGRHQQVMTAKSLPARFQHGLQVRASKSLSLCILVYIFSMFSLRSFAACLCHFWVGIIPELRIWCSWALGIRMEISSMARNGRHSAAGCQSTLPFHGTMRTRRPGNSWRRSPPYYPWHFSFGQVLQTVQEKMVEGIGSTQQMAAI